jgi:hypothetical protein
MSAMVASVPEPPDELFDPPELLDPPELESPPPINWLEGVELFEQAAITPSELLPAARVMAIIVRMDTSFI